VSLITCPACVAALPEAALLDGVDRLHGKPGRFCVRVCSRCGSGRTVPLLRSDELEPLYAQGYTTHGLPRNRGLRLIATLLYRLRYSWSLRWGMLRVLRHEPPGRLLDVGSGRGDLGVVLGGRGWRVTGLDPSEKSCAEARSRGVPSECGTLTSCGDQLRTSYYDVIVFQHSLEHVVEPSEDLIVAVRTSRGADSNSCSAAAASSTLCSLLRAARMDCR
jgi:SAM-dependent methyltransferase